MIQIITESDTGWTPEGGKVLSDRVTVAPAAIATVTIVRIAGWAGYCGRSVLGDLRDRDTEEL